MRIFNTKKGVLKEEGYVSKSNIEDRQPCWHINRDLSKSRSESQWVVSIKTYFEGDKDAPKEYRVKISDVGDVTDDKFWKYATSLDFAIRLLKMYRLGKAQEWVATGCVL